MEITFAECRYFVSYSGMKLPLNLINVLERGEQDNRNTFFRAFYDNRNRLIRSGKLIYGECELQHRYRYHDNGVLQQGEITQADGETRLLNFDSSGISIS